MYVDPPFVSINVDEACTTSLIISLIINSHPTCGNVSCNVSISGSVINSDTDDSSKYTIGELESNTTYKITVTFTYNDGFSFGEFNEFVKTALPKSPNPVNASTIKVESKDNNEIVTWKPPPIDECYMLPNQRYEVIVNSGEVEVASKITNNETTFSFKHSNNQSNVTFTISITVIDIYEQRSNPTVLVIVKTFNTVNENDEAIDELITSKTNEKQCEIFIGLAVVFIVISVITTTIIVILSWKLCFCQKKTNDAVAIPPIQLQGQINVDNIQMQPSPAYASIDSKSTQLYQNI